MKYIKRFEEINEGFWDSVFGKPTVDDAAHDSLRGQGWSHRGKETRDEETQEEEPEPTPTPETIFSKYIDEESNYLVLKFDNHQDWVYAKTLLGHLLQTVASTRTNGKPWSKGIGRVLDGVEVLNHLQNH
jgi:hypothetical protein